MSAEILETAPEPVRYFGAVCERPEDHYRAAARFAPRGPAAVVIDDLPAGFTSAVPGLVGRLRAAGVPVASRCYHYGLPAAAGAR